MTPHHYLKVLSTEVAEEDCADIQSQFLATREQNHVPSFNVSNVEDHWADILPPSQEMTSSRPKKEVSQPLQIKDQWESKNALIKAQNTHKCKKCLSAKYLLGHSLLIWELSTRVAYILISEMNMVYRDSNILWQDVFIEYQQ